MGFKSLLTVGIGMILIIVCGLISLMDYVSYLFQASFIGLWAMIGVVFGIFLFVVGMTITAGDFERYKS